MTTAEAAFLQAICAAPDSDAPRLVYADFLEETAGAAPCPFCNGKGYTFLIALPLGHPRRNEPCRSCAGSGRVSDGRAERAEFIRVQCELAGLGECGRDFSLGLGCRCRFCAAGGLALRRREWVLLEARPDGHYANKVVWFGRLGVFGYSSAWDWTFRRGFVEAVACDTSEWLDHGADVVACQPVLGVRLHDRQLVRLSNGRYCWQPSLGWEASSGPVRRGLLPPQWGPAWEEFGAPEEAWAWLSRRAVAWARAEAGLPPLPEGAAAGKVP